MKTCRQCQGSGQDSYVGSCYHCCETGQVDDETDFHDRLHAVASTLAGLEESDYRKACNEEPQGDGYNLHAYENQMTPSDYFRSRVWGRTDKIAAKLACMPMVHQELLVAWNELPFIPRAVETVPITLRSEELANPNQEDEIPF